MSRVVDGWNVCFLSLLEFAETMSICWVCSRDTELVLAEFAACSQCVEVVFDSMILEC